MLLCRTKEALAPGRSMEKPPASTAPRPLLCAAAGTSAQTSAARALPCQGHFPHAQLSKVLRAEGSWLCRLHRSSPFAWQQSSFLGEDNESHSSKGRAWRPSCLFKPSCKHRLCLLTQNSTPLRRMRRQGRDSPSCQVPPVLTARTAGEERGVSGVASYPRS